MVHYLYEVDPSVNTLVGSSHTHKKYEDVRGNPQHLENFLNALDKEGKQVFSFSPYFIVRKIREE